MNDYYVYEHWRPDKNVCFYVGKGRRSRAWHMYNRSRWHRSITSKLTSAGLALDVRIVARDLSNAEAVVLEIERIAFYGCENLVNLTIGGEGAPGRLVSVTTRAKIAKANTGKRHTVETKIKLSALMAGSKRGPHSPETIVKLSAANKKRFADPELRKAISERERGKVRSLETRRKTSAALMGNVPWNKGRKTA